MTAFICHCDSCARIGKKRTNAQGQVAFTSDNCIVLCPLHLFSAVAGAHLFVPNGDYKGSARVAQGMLFIRNLLFKFSQSLVMRCGNGAAAV